MAEVQESWPLVDDEFTDAGWRIATSEEPGIREDSDGSAYTLTMPGAGDVAQLGSATIDSTCRVAGFGHKIPAGLTQSVTIPPSTNSAVGRTDLVVVRYDPTWLTAPGPARVHVIPGVEGSGSRPAYDGGPPGVEDMPLYAVTRKQDVSLAASTVVDLRVRSGPNILVPAAEALPANVPLGTRAHRAGVEYLRRMGTSAPEWYDLTKANLDAAKAVTLAGDVRPLYVRGREGDVAVSANTSWYFSSAENTGSAGDWGPHIGITASSDSTVGDQFTIKTAGMYSIEVVYQCIVAGHPTAGVEGGYDVSFDVLAGGVGSGLASRLPRAWGEANPYTSGGIPLSSTRYWAAGSKFRLRYFANAGGTLMFWHVLIMKVSD